MPIFKSGLGVIVLLWICDCRATAPQLFTWRCQRKTSMASKSLNWITGVLKTLSLSGFLWCWGDVQNRNEKRPFMTCGLENNPRSLLHSSARSPVAASPLPLILEVVIKWKGRARGREEGDLIRDLRGHFFPPEWSIVVNQPFLTCDYYRQLRNWPTHILLDLRWETQDPLILRMNSLPSLFTVKLI